MSSPYSSKAYRLYAIPIHEIAKKNQYFDYQLDDGFFSLFPESLIKKGSLKVRVETMPILGNFKVELLIEGFVVLTCDRTLLAFNHPLNITKKLNFIIGDQEALVDDKTCIISSSTAEIHMAPHFYDFIHLALPIKKIHPHHQKKGGM